MAVAFVLAHTGVSIKTAGTTNIGVNISTATTVGNVLVARILFDNFTTASTPTVTSIAKAAGETASWVFLGAARSTSTSAGAFASGEMWAIRTTVSWPVAAYTVTLSNSVTMKATRVQEFSGVLATARSTAGTAYSTSTTAASATTTGTAPVVGDLALGFIFASNTPTVPAGDTDTTNGSWSTPALLGSSGSTANSNNAGGALYKIVTGTTHQTLNNSATLTAGNGAIVAVLQNEVLPDITQAAYRIYADGTESGSTALAAQNTAYIADISGSDMNLQVRVLLQSTSSITVPSTDDFTLLWMKDNTDESLLDSYSETNASDAHAIHSFSTLAQSFLGGGEYLSGARFYLSYDASPPTGNIVAQLYAHTGTYGFGTPVGSPLATADPVPASVLTTTPQWIRFDFLANVLLTNGTPYCIALSSGTPSGSSIIATEDATSPTHGGNLSFLSGSWNASSSDMIFEVYHSSTFIQMTPTYATPILTDGVPTTNRLTGGSGTFTAGKASTDGVVDDLGWAGNNYTEMLYSMTLKKADLTDGDTLRFRVLRNGATTGLTYTQTPTINIVSVASVGGKPKVYVGGSWTEKPAKVYIGGSWVEKPMKRFDGSVWKPI